MANIRIKDLSTTAAVTASDDFIAVDGATNGTRKLDAYSPTFGGNLTVNGGTETKLSSSGANVESLFVSNSGVGSNTAASLVFKLGNFSYGYIRSIAAVGGTGVNRLDLGANNGSPVLSVNSTGNALIGTTTDTGEKLQVNGTGYFAGALIQLGNGTADAIYRVAASTGKSTDFGDDTTGGFVRANNSQSLRFITGGNIVLTLDSSANATFAGTIKPQQAATASAPTYVKGAIYFDTTLNKLRVGGATGWETITSV